jgi:hypothetical protein
MPAILEKNIRKKLIGYLTGRISLAAFTRWFGPVLWEIETSGSRGAQRSAYYIELCLSEFDHGDWTEDELKSKFRPLVTSYSLGEEGRMQTSTSNTILTVSSSEPPGKSYRLLTPASGMKFAKASV